MMLKIFHHSNIVIQAKVSASVWVNDKNENLHFQMLMDFSEKIVLWYNPEKENKNK